VDGAVLTLLVAAGSSNSSTSGTAELAVAGLLGYGFGAPIVHWAHGNAGKGFGSLGIRAGAFTLFVAGAVSCSESHSDSGGGCILALVGALGLVAAIPIDAAVLAYDDPKDDGVSLGPLHHLALAPDVGPGSGVRAFELRDGQGAREARAPALSGLHGGLVLRGLF